MASPAIRAGKRSYAPPRAAQLYAGGGRTERTRKGLGKCWQGDCRQGTSAHAFLQALAFVQQSLGDPAPPALSALMRMDTGDSSQARQAAPAWAAALWGLLRTAALEHPDVTWTALGVDALAAHIDVMQARHSMHQSAFVCLLSDCDRLYL